MKKLIKWLRTPSFRFSVRRAIPLMADWDGDMICVGDHEYFIYHNKVHDLSWSDWFRCLSYQLFAGHGKVFRFPHA